MRCWSRAAALAATLAAGCYAGLDGAPGQGAPDPSDGEGATVDDEGATSEGSGGEEGDEGAAGPEALPSAAIGRITHAQYVNTISDVFSAAAARDLQLPADHIVDGSPAAGARRVASSRSDVRRYEAAARTVAQRAVADPSAAETWAACPGEGFGSPGCLEQIVARNGRLLFRRALVDEELERHVGAGLAALADHGDFLRALEPSLVGLLVSPMFIYRIEVGEPDGDRVRYTDLEMASRLAALLWASGPDAWLLDAAEAGQLTRVDALGPIVDAMLDDPRFDRSIAAFADELLELHALPETSKDPDRFPDASPQMRDSMDRALRALLQTVVASSPADLLDVLDPGFAFVDGNLAALYPEVDPAQVGSELSQIALPSDGRRVGLLTEPALLAIYGNELVTSPTRRGRFIRERLLCEVVPPPPPDVDDQLPVDPNGPTRREELEAHMTVPACRGCHATMDPLGFALEHFDAMGYPQELDNGRVVDASGELDGATFADARELSALLRDDARVERCFARHLFRHTFGEGEPHIRYPQRLAIWTEAFADAGHDLRAALATAVLDDAFRFAALAP